jgi:hypothetical protein
MMYDVYFDNRMLTTPLKTSNSAIIIMIDLFQNVYFCQLCYSNKYYFLFRFKKIMTVFRKRFERETKRFKRETLEQWKAIRI